MNIALISNCSKKTLVNLIIADYFLDSKVVYKESMSLMLGLLLIPKIMLS